MPTACLRQSWQDGQTSPALRAPSPNLGEGYGCSVSHISQSSHKPYKTYMPYKP